VPASAVADAGALLVALGLVEGHRHEVVNHVALDSTTLLVAEYLTLRHSGRPSRAVAEFAEIGLVVQEWFPVRGLAIDVALRTPAGDLPDAWASLLLAEALEIPLVTKNAEVRSRKVPVLVC
jgi:hypothetical protein